MIAASVKDSEKLVDLLLARDADVNQTSECSSEPLMSYDDFVTDMRLSRQQWSGIYGLKALRVHRTLLRLELALGCVRY